VFVSVNVFSTRILTIDTLKACDDKNFNHD